MDYLETIRNTIRAMKDEASSENRPNVNRRLLEDMVEAYDKLTYIDLSDSDRSRTIGMLNAVSTIKRFLEMGEPDQVQLRLRSMVISYI